MTSAARSTVSRRASARPSVASPVPAVLALLTALAVLAVPASPAGASAAAPAVPSTGGTTSTGEGAEPVDAVTAAERAQAEVERQAALLAAEEAQRDADQAAAGAALERLSQARRRLDQATREAADQAVALRGAARASAEADARLTRYAGALYRNGADGFPMQLLSALLDPADPRDVLSGAAVAERAGANQSDALDALTRAQRRQADLARSAASAAAVAQAAAAEAAAAEAAARDAVARSAARVEAAAAELASREGAAAVAAARAELLRRAEAAAGSTYRSFPDCDGGTVTGAANGLLPVSALCPLWGAPGHHLRADAAAAFNRLALAYAEHFGAPLCVTDSYRDLAGQVAVAAAKPGLAAVPGTSNHGWGVAVDLCGGVQTFGTPQHEWMQENATASGWFHPAWAQATGSKPEAWHWEYAGQ